ncbi:hypothetical protein [Nocardioides bizhenqiangii]|uniref:Major facilitator superfamily (MFS) profile domain-containing protein n=1 Tax=Nocardioides bizhenqiangii TaxID=3095076 RepID=A0ABZ0ZP40_9ACTN|nr:MULTISPECIES: hypothetical protein [unclassified Nocardioides]MDZ5619917.1 hypothetical protein [Nocardioides sp. HM23]WQQ26079.1 hypothetical protein SHK19_19205 [Nocardioides sp. HM61]
MPRILAYLVLLVAGVLSLPVAAAFFDGEGSEDWILPVQLGGMAAVGALVGLATPALVGDGAATGRRVIVGALLGIGAALVGVALFFLLLNGFDGA